MIGSSSAGTGAWTGKRSLIVVNVWRQHWPIIVCTNLWSNMKRPLQITFRDMMPLPSVEPEIRRRADRLDQWTPDVMSCQVVVEAEGNRHRTGQPGSTAP